MLPVDQLLALLFDGQGNVSRRMDAAGYTEDQIREAWDEARREGLTEATGLGADRLTEAGRAPRSELAIDSMLGPGTTEMEKQCSTIFR